ncbi:MULTISPECIES: class I SAM-dependent methyltransferase [Brevibacterium]|nr:MULTISPECIES: class I SAM-dependent methyltransferase [Brevibacterium]
MRAPAFDASEYEAMSGYLRNASERLIDCFTPPPPRNQRPVLGDIGCGDGNFALAAVRAGWRSFGIDISTAQIAAARSRAKLQGITVDAEFHVLDEREANTVINLADAVGSVFGVIFAEDPDAAVHRMVRLVRTGGQIGLCVWGNPTASGVLRRTLAEAAGITLGIPDLPMPWEGEPALRGVLDRADVSNITIKFEDLATSAANFSEALDLFCTRAPVLRRLRVRARAVTSDTEIESTCHAALEREGSIRIESDGRVSIMDRYMIAHGYRSL